MDISRLKTYTYVAQFGSFQKAAEKLFLSQRAVSKQITQMEQELGVTLFNRGKNNISLTPAGETFYASAQDIINNYDHAVSELHGVSDNSQSLKVGYFSMFEQKLLQNGLLKLIKDHPDVNVTIKEASNEHLLESVRNHELDLALSIQYGNNPMHFADLTVTSIYQNTMAMGVSKLNPLSEQSELPLEHLNDLPILYYSPETSTYLQNSFLTSVPENSAQKLQRVASVEQMHFLVTMNKAFAFYPKGLVATQDDTISFLKIAGGSQTYDIVAIYDHKNSNQLLTDLLKLLK